MGSLADINFPNWVSLGDPAWFEAALDRLLKWDTIKEMSPDALRLLARRAGIKTSDIPNTALASVLCERAGKLAELRNDFSKN